MERFKEKKVSENKSTARCKENRQKKSKENKNTARGKENRHEKSKEEKKSTARDIKELIITIRVHICIGI